MPTTNPVPSLAPSDMLFNVSTLDSLINGNLLVMPKRLGGNILTWAGLVAQFNGQSEVLMAGLTAEVAVTETAQNLAASQTLFASTQQAAQMASSSARRYASTTLAQADASVVTGVWYSTPDATYPNVLKNYERVEGGSTFRGINALSLGYVFADEATGRTAILGMGGGLGTRFAYLGTTGNEVVAQISNISGAGASTVIFSRVTAGSLLNATSGRRVVDATALVSPYTLSAEDRQYSMLTITGTPAEEPFRIITGTWSGVIENQLTPTSRTILARFDGTDAGISIPYGYRPEVRAGNDGKVHGYPDQGSLEDATVGRATISVAGASSPYTLTDANKKFSLLRFVGVPVDVELRVVIGGWSGVIVNDTAAGRTLLIRVDGSDPGFAIAFGSRPIIKPGPDNIARAYPDMQALLDEGTLRAAADSKEVADRKTEVAGAKDLLLASYTLVASRIGVNQHVGHFANAVGIDCAAGGDVLPGFDIKRVPIRCMPGTGATKAVIKISSRSTAGGTVDSAPGAAGDVEIIALTRSLAELGLVVGVQSTTNVVLPYPFRTVDGFTYIREMEFQNDAGTRIASNWGSVIQSGLAARKRGYYRLTAGAAWSTFDSASNPTEWRLEQAVYTQSADISASVAAVTTAVAPINATLAGEARAASVGRRYRSPKPSYIDAGLGLLIDLPLTSSLFANVGADLPFGRTGASAVVDCYGAWQPTRSGEARFWGARRVENTLLDDTFTSGWTLGPAASKAAITNRMGPYRQRMNIQRFTRASGTGAFTTLNSASYRPGQRTFSVYAGSVDGVSTYIWQLQRSADNVVIAERSITPSVSAFTRYALSFSIPDTQNYRITLVAAAGAGPIDLACPQFERTQNQNGSPNEYVPRGSVWDAAPWQGAGVDGVRCFDYYNPCNIAADGVVTESRTRVEIPGDVLKGLMIGPTRVNKFYESRDVGAASWTLTNATAASAMIASGLLGPSSLRKLEETAATGLHRATQTWKGTLPADNVMITIAAFVPLVMAERSLLVLSFLDKAGAEKKAIVNVATRTVLSESGNIFKTHITQIGDLLRVGFTDTSGVGSTAPIGSIGLATLVSGSVVESYAGTAGAGMYLGALQFERTDHPCIYLGDTGTTTPGGTADDTNTPVFPAAMGPNNWTVTCECTPMYDSDSQTKASWSYVWYATKASNIRWGCGIRPGAFGGAVVEQYVKNPVFDCYAGPDGLGVPQTPNEVFDVANVLHITPALQTVLWQNSLHPAAYDGASNIAMYVGAKQGELDHNGTNLVSRVPVGTGPWGSNASVVFSIGYKLTPIDEKCIKNFRVFGFATTWQQMAAAVAG